MKKTVHSRLWIYFACIVFCLIVLTAFCLSLVVLLLNSLGWWNPDTRNPLMSIIILTGFSTLVGTGVAGFVGHRILQPIAHLRKNMRRVAEGDFSLQLEEQQRIEEVGQLYHDFNIMVKELNSIETLRNDFVSNVSHEFKTPLATIRGYVQLLQDPALPKAQRKEFLKRILEGTKQLSQLTENILKLSKLENQGLRMERAPFRLDEQIREVILFLQPQWEQNGLELDIELANITFWGSEELLYQVWLNLIDNAIKYNRPGGVIKVQLTQEQERVFLEVVDTGIGMSKDTQLRLFDKFFQGDTSRKAAGNGLGLVLAKKITELHGGQIAFNSREGSGTTFIIALPVHNEFTIT